MDLMTNDHLYMPAMVKEKYENEYEKNYLAITRGAGRLFLFSCDQKIEHLNKDFYGPGIDLDDNNPEHLFKIAEQGNIGAFATHLGLISHYGKQYSTINYIVKLNAKTDLVSYSQRDPISYALWNIDQILEFKQRTKLSIAGIGYTIYLGSEFESQMLAQAATLIYQAQSHGLVTILWMYPRGKSVKQEKSGELIAGAAGVAVSLGADFAKINSPEPSEGKTTEDWLKIACQAAGKTKLIISGGSKIEEQRFLDKLSHLIKLDCIAGTATGRNIHQRSLADAVALTHAISSVIYAK